MNNADKIRSMSDEELALFLWKISLNVYIQAPTREETEAWLDWLKQEAGNG